MKLSDSSLGPAEPVLSTTNKPPIYYLIPGLLLLTFILIRNLWVSDDAFITLRVVDNFLHGYGLVWNIGERVQVFTHPLWLFILIPVSFFIPDPLYVFYIPSYLFSLVTSFLLLWNFAPGRRYLILAVIALGSSMSFIDFSSSGLENPLTHFLLISFLVLYLHQDQPVSTWRLFHLSLIAGLAALNRLDTILLLGPALLFQLISGKGEKRKEIIFVGAGFLPLFLWELFATFYYGFPLPNPYYVKAQTGLDMPYLLMQGWAYIKNSIHWDPLTLGTVVLGVLSIFVHRDGRRIAIATGIVSYIFYILWVGGDFMSGRFFSGVFLMGLVLLLTFDAERAFGPVPDKLFLALLAGVLLVGLSANRPPIFISGEQPGQTDDQYGIVNEKHFYFYANGWINYVHHSGLHYLATDGIQAGQSGQAVVEMNTIGMYGYYAGPRVYIFDSHALSDPLRAHLPVNGPSRVGHYERVRPKGYWETIQSGFTENLIEDPNLHLYYEKMCILTRGDLFSMSRLSEIVRFNFGYYDPLVDQYWESLHSGAK
ncbi:MAG: hypothetical protein JNM02_12865 [Anaerolineales bacterium]|nr:hypothetical protein [Anaerolineales bacterium]